MYKIRPKNEKSIAIIIGFHSEAAAGKIGVNIYWLWGSKAHKRPNIFWGGPPMNGKFPINCPIIEFGAQFGGPY